MSFIQDAKGNGQSLAVHSGADSVEIDNNHIAIHDGSDSMLIVGPHGSSIGAMIYGLAMLVGGVVGFWLCLWLTRITWRALVRYVHRQLDRITARLDEGQSRLTQHTHIDLTSVFTLDRKERVMNMHYSGSAATAARPHHSSEPVYPAAREVSVRRLADWLAQGFGLVRAQPVLWLAAILGCADFATLLELAPPLRLLAALIVPIVAAALMLMQERSHNARPWSIGETLAALDGHRNALITIGLAGAAVIGAGQLISFAAFHVTMTASVAADGVHNLSIVYGAHNGATNALEPLLSALLKALVYAVAIALVWFAPALVVLHNLSPRSAMMVSLRAVVRNWRIALVYALAIAADVLLAAAVPTVVRGLVVTPLLSALFVLSMYGSYRDLFAER